MTVHADRLDVPVSAPAGSPAARLGREPFVAVTSFKRDGTPVSTPVWCTAEGGALLVFTEVDSWKVKRIRHDHHVRVAPCSARGKPRGPAVDADARIVSDTEAVKALLADKYGLTWRGYTRFVALVRWIRRQAPPAAVTIRTTPRSPSDAG